MGYFQFRLYLYVIVVHDNEKESHIKQNSPLLEIYSVILSLSKFI